MSSPQNAAGRAAPEPARRARRDREIWVRLEGALTEKPDVVSTWAILSPKPTARETLEFAAEFGRVMIYGDACYSPRGQRAVQRWLLSHGLADLVYWTSPDTEAPKDAHGVIDSWPMVNSLKGSAAVGRATTPTP